MKPFFDDAPLISRKIVGRQPVRYMMDHRAILPTLRRRWSANSSPRSITIRWVPRYAGGTGGSSLYGHLQCRARCQSWLRSAPPYSSPRLPARSWVLPAMWIGVGSWPGFLRFADASWRNHVKAPLTHARNGQSSASRRSESRKGDMTCWRANAGSACLIEFQSEPAAPALIKSRTPAAFSPGPVVDTTPSSLPSAAASEASATRLLKPPTQTSLSVNRSPAIRGNRTTNQKAPAYRITGTKALSWSADITPGSSSPHRAGKPSRAVNPMKSRSTVGSADHKPDMLCQGASPRCARGDIGAILVAPMRCIHRTAREIHDAVRRSQNTYRIGKDLVHFRPCLLKSRVEAGRLQLGGDAGRSNEMPLAMNDAMAEAPMRLSPSPWLTS